MPFAIARRRDEDVHHCVDVVVVETDEGRHRVGSAAGECFVEPPVVDGDRLNIVELLRVFVDRLACGRAEAGDWQGQARMGFAVVEVCVQAFEERPLGGGERHRVQDLQPGLQGGPCLMKRCHINGRKH